MATSAARLSHALNFCTVCLEPYTPGGASRAMALPCGNKACVACVRRATGHQGNVTCPGCYATHRVTWSGRGVDAVATFAREEQDEAEEECLICWELLQEPPVTLPCRHALCIRCLETLRGDECRVTCPFCRKVHFLSDVTSCSVDVTSCSADVTSGSGRCYRFTLGEVTRRTVSATQTC